MREHNITREHNDLRETSMRARSASFPEMALIAGTRGLLGLGIGLLVSEHFRNRRLRTVGWSLVAIGALSTIPIAIHLFRGRTPRTADVTRTRPDPFGRPDRFDPIDDRARARAAATSMVE